MPEDRKEQVALFRYSVISEAVSDRLSHTERGLVVRALATKPWVTPEGDERFISRTTIDRWVGAYRRDGLSGLEPEPRSDKGHGRANPELMAEAVRLRRQVPARSAAQIAEIIARAHGVRLAERTPARASGAFGREPGGDQRRSCQGLRALRGLASQRDLDR
jgi:putative transposase